MFITSQQIWEKEVLLLGMLIILADSYKYISHLNYKQQKIILC